MIFRPFLPIAVLLLVVGLVDILLGFFVVAREKRNAAQIIFSLFCLFIGLWSVSVGLVGSGLFHAQAALFTRAVFLVALPIPLIIFLFSITFPDEDVHYSRLAIFSLSIPLWVLLANIPGKTLLDPTVVNEGMRLELGPWIYFYALYFILYFSGAFIKMGGRYRNASSTEKIRYRYFFSGIVLASVIGVFCNVVLVVFFNKSSFVYFGPLGTIFVTGLTAFAILRYRLMDVGLAIKKTTAYSLVTTGITFFYVIVVLGLEFISRSVFGYDSLLAAILAALVIAITFVPIRARLQAVADRIFFRRMVEYQGIIKDVTRLIVSVTDLSTLFRLIDRTIVRAMCVKNASILLLEEKQEHFLVEKINGLPDSVKGIKLALDNPLVLYLIEKKDAVVQEEIKGLLHNDSISLMEKERLRAIQKEMEHFEAAVSIPSFLKDELVGILNLGEKQSGEPYSPDDLELLLTMGTEAAVAIENAKLYRDITETRDYLNNLVQGSSDAIVTMDMEGKVLSWNEGARKIFGYSAAKAIGEVPPFFSEKEIKEYIGRLLRGEELAVIELNKVNREGKALPLLLTLSKIFDAGGQFAAVSAIFKDISELKKVDQLKNEFLSVISHELRTPLTPIKGYLSLLLEDKMGKVEPKQKETLQVILNQSNHLLDLIDGMIDVARSEAGRPLELLKEPVFLEEIIKESLEMTASMFSGRGIAVNADFREGHAAILADRRKLLRVMANLLGNAAKFTPPNGQVTISIKNEGKGIIVSVEDSGIGIASQHLDKIFNKFFQVDTSYTRSTGGVGMGLAIAKEIVAAHGGRIWAESEGSGRGSKFSFSLPVG